MAEIRSPRGFRHAGRAERGLRRLIEAESLRPPPSIHERARTVDDVADELRERLAIEGARLSYRQNCESMQRIHISPAIGKRRIESVTRKAGAARPKRRCEGDANPDEVVASAPTPTRRGRTGPAPPLPPDVLGPVLRVLMRWKDVDLDFHRRSSAWRGVKSRDVVYGLLPGFVLTASD